MKMTISSCLPSGPIKGINLHWYCMPRRGGAARAAVLRGREGEKDPLCDGKTKWRSEARVSISSMQPHGDPVLFQYLFWFYSHPTVYIMSLSLIATGGGLSFWKRRRLSL